MHSKANYGYSPFRVILLCIECSQSSSFQMVVGGLGEADGHAMVTSFPYYHYTRVNIANLNGVSIKVLADSTQHLIIQIHLFVGVRMGVNFGSTLINQFYLLTMCKCSN